MNYLEERTLKYLNKSNIVQTLINIHKTFETLLTINKTLEITIGTTRIFFTKEVINVIGKYVKLIIYVPDKSIKEIHVIETENISIIEQELNEIIENIETLSISLGIFPDSILARISHGIVNEVINKIVDLLNREIPEKIAIEVFTEIKRKYLNKIYSKIEFDLKKLRSEVTELIYHFQKPWVRHAVGGTTCDRYVNTLTKVLHLLDSLTF